MSRPMMTRNTTAAAPRVEPKPDIDPRTGKPDWSRYNATVVGNTPSTNVRTCWAAHPPGLECGACTPGYVEPVYRNVSFAATREYADDEGWQHVGKSRHGRRGRSWHGKNKARQEEA